MGRTAVIVADLRPADFRYLESANLGEEAGINLRAKVNAALANKGNSDATLA
jgi:hypothetical protein